MTANPGPPTFGSFIGLLDVSPSSQVNKNAAIASLSSPIPIQPLGLYPAHRKEERTEGGQTDQESNDPHGLLSIQTIYIVYIDLS